MKRKIIYRRILLSILAAAIIFGIYFINKYPLYSVENESTDGKKIQKDIVSVNTTGNAQIYPCGFPIGIYLQTKGVMIIGTDGVKGENGLNYNPALNKVQAGDYIQR